MPQLAGKGIGFVQMNTLATNTYSPFLDHTVTSLDMLEITETVAEGERGHQASDTSHKWFTSNHLPSVLLVPAHAILHSPALPSRAGGWCNSAGRLITFFFLNFWLYLDSQKSPAWWTLRYSWAVNAIWKASPHISFPLLLFYFLAHISAQFDQNQSLISSLEPILPAPKCVCSVYPQEVMWENSNSTTATPGSKWDKSQHHDT